MQDHWKTLFMMRCTDLSCILPRPQSMRRYWLQGLGDGNNGRWPELCVELPYLSHRETTEPLMLAYRVANADGTRTELNRTTLDSVITRLLEDTDSPTRIAGRAKIVAFALRRIAERLERLSLGG